METNHSDAEKRIEAQYDKDPDYVFNLAIVHQKDVHPIMIATTLGRAKKYVKRVMALYNKSQIDADLVAPYSEEMWIKASDTMHVFVLAPGSEYRILRMKLNDDSYLDKQEELAGDDTSTSNSLSV